MREPLSTDVPVLLLNQPIAGFGGLSGNFRTGTFWNPMFSKSPEQEKKKEAKTLFKVVKQHCGNISNNLYVTKIARLK